MRTNSRFASNHSTAEVGRREASAIAGVEEAAADSFGDLGRRVNNFARQAPFTACAASFVVGLGVGALAVYALRQRESKLSESLLNQFGERTISALGAVLPDAVTNVLRGHS